MNEFLNDEYFEDLRDDGLLLVDAEARKVGVVENTTGQVLLVCEEDGEGFVFSICPDEINAICAALQAAGRKATAIGNRIEAEYQTFTAIQKAAGQ